MNAHSVADIAGGVLFATIIVMPGLAVVLALSALDEMMVDIAYLMLRRRRHAARPCALASQLMDVEIAPLALFIPAWNEADVIGVTVRLCLRRFDHPNIRIFVGLYPNDPRSWQALKAIDDPRLHLVSVPHPGPTTKADCLNSLWAALPLVEARTPDWQAQAIVLHDAEDLVSPLEPYVISRLLDNAEMIQLPVLPLPVPGSRWVSCSYIDEFAVGHGRDLPVRQALGAGLPSAGVGCAFARRALDVAAAARGGRPFADDAVTEDYDLALWLAEQGMRQRFVRLPHAPRLPELVATSAYFPDTLGAAIKQKARWLRGITLQGADRLAWRGSWARRWFLLRDRKALLVAWLNIIAMLVALPWCVYGLWQLVDPAAPHFSPPWALWPWLAPLLLFNGLSALYRSGVRAAFVGRDYGWRHALWSVPRQLVAHVINAGAAARAIVTYVQDRRRGQVRWEATSHRLPSSLLEPAE
jgi:bacteriophage N4 adsorption protein B